MRGIIRNTLAISSLLMASLTAAAAAAAAETDVDALIDKVANAYGGKALENIRNYRVTEHYIAPNTGQSWTPALVDIGYTNQDLVHDMEGGRLYFENWFAGRSGVFPGLTIVNGEDAHAVNLQNKSYGDAASADPYVIAGGTMRTTDTLVVLELLKARDKAEHLGTASFMNREHDMLKIPFPSSPELTLYIDSQTGQVNRMTRDNPQLGLLDYVYNDHKTVNGILRATNVNFSIAGDPNLIGASRDIRFNGEIDAQQFALPEGLSREGERIDLTEVTVNKLAKNVYHIGSNGGYSIFVDTGSEIVGCGGYAGLTDRLARFRQETDNHKPLGHQVVSHHHNDHLGGVGEALDLGARLVTVPANVEPISEAANRDIEPGRFLTVDGRMTLGSGKNRVEVYEVSTLHSVSNLLFYIPATRTVFMADHFGSPYKEGTPVANRNTMSMAQALEPLSLSFNKVATAHSARIYSDRDFDNSVKAYRDFDCPDDRPLCSR